MYKPENINSKKFCASEAKGTFSSFTKNTQHLTFQSPRSGVLTCGKGF